MKYVETRIISQVINGHKYMAKQIISGKRNLTQKIEFMDHIQFDSQVYLKEERNVMDAWAQHILWELITFGWIGHPALEPQEPASG
jgi:valyl-tRNA synthetase